MSTISCGGKPYWQGSVTAHGDGTVKTQGGGGSRRSASTRTASTSSAPISSTTGRPSAAVTDETSLARPLIVTGRGDVATRAAAVAPNAAAAPVRVELASLGIDAPVSPVGIDLEAGALGVAAEHPPHRLVEGRREAGRRKGAVLIAGHVDSAKAGAGAFHDLHRAKVGDRVKVHTANGKTITYRVTSVRTIPEETRCRRTSTR